MSEKLEKIGVRLDVEGVDDYAAKLKKAADATQGAATKFKSLSDNIGDGVTGLLNKMEQAGGVFGMAAGQIGGLTRQAQSFIPVLGGMNAGLVTLGGAAALGIGALANRGATLTGLEDSFERLTGSIGLTADTLLRDMSVAAKGTVTNFDLIRRANDALSGATGEFGKEFGQALPQILRIAQAQSNATGKEIGFLFNSIVTGVKKSSPLWIDNASLILSQSEAYRKYAASIGVAENQLTAVQKSTAFLREVMSVGNAAIAAFGDQAETAADKLSRANSGIANALDSLALGVQPAFEAALDAANPLIDLLERAADFIGPLFGSVLNTVITPIGAAVELVTAGIDILTTALSPFGAVLTGVFGIVEGVSIGIGNFVGNVTNAAQTTANQLGFIAGQIEVNLFGTNVKVVDFFNEFTVNMGRGAGFAFAAFGAAVGEAGVWILEKVADLAEGIAQFLVGESPPPKGPLSRIDIGGRNTMLAWLEGVSSVSLQPVSEVAENVNIALGDIGKFDENTVTARLKGLDAALLPFKNQLDIVKARFEEIAAPAEAALRAIERQQGAALKALNSGAVGSGELVRKLDEQRSALLATVDLEQERIDQAQIQLALAQAQQGEERTLLDIRLAQLKAAEKVADVTKATATVTTPKIGGGGASTPQPQAAPTVTPSLGATPRATQTPGQDFVAGFGQGQTVGNAAFASPERDARFASATTRIGAAGSKIAGANIRDRIAGAFTGIGDKIKEQLDNAARFIGDFGDFIVNPSREGGLINTVTRSAVDAMAKFTQFTTDLNDAFVVPITGLINDVGGVFRGFFTADSPESLQGAFNAGIAIAQTIPARLGNILAGTAGVIVNSLIGIVEGGLNAIIESVEGTLNSALTGLADGFKNLEAPLVALGQQQLYNDLTGRLSSADVNLPRVSLTRFTPPTFATDIPAAAMGGVFGSGIVQVGERGRELVALGADKNMIFPNNVVRALETIADRIMYLPAPNGGGNSNTYNNGGNTYNYSVQGTGSGAADVLTLRMMQAYGGR